MLTVFASEAIYWILLIILKTFCAANKLCEKYEIGTSNPSLLSLHHESIGLYNIHTTKSCNGRPVFKHQSQDRYLYVQGNGTWIIGDSSGYKSCKNWAYLYHPDVTRTQIPPIEDDWMYWDYNRNHWRKDKQLKLHCICTMIEVTTDKSAASEHQPEIFGRYRINDDHTCNNRVTYKHVKNDRFVYVDGYDRWVISNKAELHGKERPNPCTHWAYAFHISRPSTYIPGKIGWRYKSSENHEWFTDHTMNVDCICESYRVHTSNPYTKYGIKSNLLGVYNITEDTICNKRPTFKHVSRNLYLYVDNTGDWMISHGADMSGKGSRKRICDSMGFAFNPTSPTPNEPSISGWRYFSFQKFIWILDPQMKVECV